MWTYKTLLAAAAGSAAVAAATSNPVAIKATVATVVALIVFTIWLMVQAERITYGGRRYQSQEGQA